MCAVQTSTKPTNNSTKQASGKTEPKWLIMKRQNKSSADKKKKVTVKSSASAQKPNQHSRDEKRKRWAKKQKPVAKPVVRRGPVYEYISDCCGIPCTKPRAGMKVTLTDPETGKPSKKEITLGLGHWRCNGVGGCKKSCTVTRKSPAKAEAPVVGNMQGQETAPYPAPLQTPVVISAPVAQ
jgi:hypothetical protein